MIQQTSFHYVYSAMVYKALTCHNICTGGLLAIAKVPKGMEAMFNSGTCADVSQVPTKTALCMCIYIFFFTNAQMKLYT